MRYIFDMTKLKAIEKETGKRLVVKVGILGNTNERHAQKVEETKSQYKKRIKKLDAVSDAAPVTNAEIGMVHEYGSKSRNIPKRSWLKMPLITQSDKLFGEAKQLLHDMCNENIEKQYKLLGASAEAIIQRAFATSGFGSWKKPKYRDGKPLVDTSQLRNSVTSAVVSG